MARATGTTPDPLPGQLDASFRGTVDSTTWEIDHHFITNGGELTPPADFDVLLTELYAVFAERIIRPLCHSRVHFHEVWGHLWSEHRSRLEHRKAGTAVGDNGGLVAPAQVATLIRWSTLDHRRGGQPCTYVPGVPMAFLEDDAHFYDARVAIANDTVNAYIADVRQIEAGSVRILDFVDLSLVANGAYRLTPDASTIVTGSVRRVPATQRRRIDRAA